MPITLPQLSVLADATGPRVVGRSAGIPFEVEEAVLRTVVRYGSHAGQPSAVFRTTLNGGLGCLVTVAKLPGDGSPTAFRYVVGPRDLLAAIEPFGSIDRIPADVLKGDLDAFVGDEAFRPRGHADLRALLKSGDSPLLLGAAQALLDGCKIAVAAAEVPPTFVRDLWQLLPFMSRAELSFATFAPSAELNFDVAVLPAVPVEGIKGFLTAEQVRDYPEGRYELALQRAAENGNQADLDRLFARRSSSQVLRTVVGMIVFALVVVIVLKFL